MLDNLLDLNFTPQKEKQPNSALKTSKNVQAKQVRYNLSPAKNHKQFSSKELFDSHNTTATLRQAIDSNFLKNFSPDYEYSNYEFQNDDDISDLDSNIILQRKDLCHQCGQLDHMKRKYGVIDNVDCFYGNGIYTINGGNTIKMGRLSRTTISEESLSECSLSTSESCDCKYKSITIKLPKPSHI